MRILRIFIKPNGSQWFDFPMSEGMDLPRIMANVRTEGMIMSDKGFVPYDSIHFGAVLEIMGQPSASIVPFRPPEAS